MPQHHLHNAPSPFSRCQRLSCGQSAQRYRPVRRRAFSLIELLVVIAILGVLIAILIPVMRRARTASQSVTCLANLRQISVAFHLFAEQNGKRYPDPSVTRVSWEASLAPYTVGNTFACPADAEIFPSVGSSYDWRDTPSPATTLAGKMTGEAARSSLVLAFEALPGWHSKKRINAVLLDGSARDMDYDICLQDLEKPNNLPQ
jgi:prepilin-type N-terminal cleavage/methylation domain-containing protein